MKVFGLICTVVCGIVLLYGTVEFPDWGDPSSPASMHVSPYYIEKSMSDTSVPNMVTAVLADYRGFDTMFETTVIFAAGIACFFLLRIAYTRAAKAMICRHIPTGITIRVEGGRDLPAECREFEKIDSLYVPYDLIVRITARLVIPFIQLFALYVVAHGHHSPGADFREALSSGPPSFCTPFPMTCVPPRSEYPNVPDRC